LKAVVSVGVLVVIAFFVPVTDVIDTVKAARPDFLLAGWALFVFAYFVGAWSLRILTKRQGVSISTLSIFEVNLATQFYQLFLPGGFVTGGVVRWYKITRYDHKPAEVLAAILFNRMLEVWSLSLLALGFFLLDGEASRQPLLSGVLAVVFATLCVLYLISISRWAWRRFDGIVDSLSVLPNMIREHTLKLSKSLAHFNTFDPVGHAIILALAVFRNLIRIASLACFSNAIELDLTTVTLTWVRSFTQLVNLVPISYSGLGIRELSLLALLKPYDLSEVAIVSLSMLWFSSLLVAAFLGGLLEARTFLTRRRGRASVKTVRLSGED
jgi:uncharacterized membrane protein YbhN (UPF0104 family)